MKIVILNHPWSTFPSVAELRQACVSVMDGRLGRLTACEAWEMAWKAVRRVDLELPHTLMYLESLPAVVRRAIEAFGLPSLCYGKESIGVVRGQFLKMYEQLASSDYQAKLLPANLAKSITSRPKEVVRLTEKIGQME